MFKLSIGIVEVVTELSSFSPNESLSLQECISLLMRLGNCVSFDFRQYLTEIMVEIYYKKCYTFQSYLL